jgi:hypothetical protein
MWIGLVGADFSVMFLTTFGVIGNSQRDGSNHVALLYNPLCYRQL